MRQKQDKFTHNTIYLEVNYSKHAKIPQPSQPSPTIFVSPSKVEVKLLSHVRLFATPWTVTYQFPPSTGFSRQEYQRGLPFPPPGDHPNPGIKPRSPALQANALPPSHQGSQTQTSNTITYSPFSYYQYAHMNSTSPSKWKLKELASKVP